MDRIEAIIRPERLDAVKDALASAGFIGLNVYHLSGRGQQKGVAHVGRAGERVTVEMVSRFKVEIVVRGADTQRVVDIISKAASTSQVGDGIIMVTPLKDVIRIRTGERGEKAV